MHEHKHSIVNLYNTVVISSFSLFLMLVTFFGTFYGINCKHVYVTGFGLSILGFVLSRMFYSIAKDWITSTVSIVYFSIVLALYSGWLSSVFTEVEHEIFWKQPIVIITAASLMSVIILIITHGARYSHHMHNNHGHDNQENNKDNNSDFDNSDCSSCTNCAGCNPWSSKKNDRHVPIPKFETTINSEEQVQSNIEEPIQNSVEEPISAEEPIQNSIEEQSQNEENKESNINEENTPQQ